RMHTAGINDTMAVLGHGYRDRSVMIPLRVLPAHPRQRMFVVFAVGPLRFADVEICLHIRFDESRKLPRFEQGAFISCLIRRISVRFGDTDNHWLPVWAKPN